MIDKKQKEIFDLHNQIINLNELIDVLEEENQLLKKRIKYLEKELHTPVFDIYIPENYWS